MASRPHPLRWAKVLGWLILLACAVVGIGAANGAASERQLVAASLYFVMAFGFAVGLLIAARIGRDDQSSAFNRYSAAAFVGAIGAGVAAFARRYYLRHFF